MALKFSIGDSVHQIVPAPFQGQVVEAAIVDGDVHFCVQAVVDGETVSRYFSGDQLEALTS